jgi:hypothetical protein
MRTLTERRYSSERPKVKGLLSRANSDRCDGPQALFSVSADAFAGERISSLRLLQSNWMTRGEAASVASIDVPTGADIATVMQVGRIEA